jgi:hypothetical protein
MELVMLVLVVLEKHQQLLDHRWHALVVAVVVDILTHLEHLVDLVVEATVEMVADLDNLMDLTAATILVVVVEVVDQDQPVELVV